jgi:HD-GYP domain-containing protein (c-di-GMP phosphodiesterase class II)
MQAAVGVIRRVTLVRDQETGAHLARMARYARMIALKLAGRHGLSDESIEYLFQFAPLHDVGKISVPDTILLKPGKLTPQEFKTMQGHVVLGLDLIDLMAEDFDMRSMSYFSMLRNIIAYHHEALDGSGYPHGLRGEEIPLEARITAVADVFDALTSERPYKRAWTNQDAFDLLLDMSGTKFDPDCVAAMLECEDEIRDIQDWFAEVVFD